MFKKTMTSIAALAFMTGIATAQMGATDIAWTMEDFMIAFPEATPELFDEVDTNNDGVIDSFEYEAAVEAGLIDPVEGGETAPLEEEPAPLD
ncbi:MAG: EF-hand domain-containing protein [Rhodobacteraceae bacterium]|nr:EF-hand domain-containing protein [Paracoccaceae bacterium]